jgi:hypothetical protein
MVEVLEEAKKFGVSNSITEAMRAILLKQNEIQFAHMSFKAAK